MQLMKAGGEWSKWLTVYCLMAGDKGSQERPVGLLATRSIKFLLYSKRSSSSSSTSFQPLCDVIGDSRPKYWRETLLCCLRGNLDTSWIWSWCLLLHKITRNVKIHSRRNLPKCNSTNRVTRILLFYDCHRSFRYCFAGLKTSPITALLTYLHTGTVQRRMNCSNIIYIKYNYLYQWQKCFVNFYFVMDNMTICKMQRTLSLNCFFYLELGEVGSFV